MKTLRVAGLLALAGPVVLQQLAAAWAWGAIAVSNEQASRWGYSYDYSTEQAAINRAVRDCGGGCKAVITFARGCGAYAYGAIDGDSEFGVGTGRNRAQAEDNALDDCEIALWDVCDIVVWACNGR
ncbi:MAG: DUF4189 domain-containing protein [Hyphomicrobiales bacterium]|nr:DUF4189 domain-containing protein [Hyphomicrobiales bacterium]